MARLVQMLTYKAEKSGGRLAKVDGKHTSLDCPECAVRTAKPSSQRSYDCCACGLTIDRDWNAAKNIQARGLVQASPGTGRRRT